MSKVKKAAASRSTERRAVERAVPAQGLCPSCIWDCVQPFGVTVVCPHWGRRAPEAERLQRTGQVAFGFGGAADGAARARAAPTPKAAGSSPQSPAAATEAAATAETALAREAASAGNLPEQPAARSAGPSTRKYDQGLFEREGPKEPDIRRRKARR